MGCQLAEELASGFGLRALACEHCVDVLTDGFAFRLFLASDRCETPKFAMMLPAERRCQHLARCIYRT